MLKNTLVYYLFMLTPFVVLMYLGKQIDSGSFAIAFFCYCLIYRPVLDRKRLIDKGVIHKSKAFRFYFPGLSYFFFKELYLP